MSRPNIFQESDNSFSMRRLLAFLFALVSFVAGLLSAYKGASWQAIAVSFGIPSLTCILLLFFTTWTDIAQVTGNLKK